MLLNCLDLDIINTKKGFLKSSNLSFFSFFRIFLFYLQDEFEFDDEDLETFDQGEDNF